MSRRRTRAATVPQVQVPKQVLDFAIRTPDGRALHAARVKRTGDLSLYFWPVSTARQYFTASNKLLSGEASETVDLNGEFDTQLVPHLSLHQSGRFHIRTARKGEDGFQEVRGWHAIPLKELRGQHMVTVLFSPNGLPDYRKNWDEDEPTAGSIIRTSTAPEAPLYRMLFYTNGQERKCDADGVNHWYDIEHPVHGRIHLGFLLQPEYEITPPPEDPTFSRFGSWLMGGWDPRRGPSEEQSMYWIKAGRLGDA